MEFSKISLSLSPLPIPSTNTHHHEDPPYLHDGNFCAQSELSSYQQLYTLFLDESRYANYCGIMLIYTINSYRNSILKEFLTLFTLLIKKRNLCFSLSLFLSHSISLTHSLCLLHHKAFLPTFFSTFYHFLFIFHIVSLFISFNLEKASYLFFGGKTRKEKENKRNPTQLKNVTCDIFEKISLLIVRKTCSQLDFLLHFLLFKVSMLLVISRKGTSTWSYW